MEEAPLYVKFLMYLFVVVYMVSVTLETTRGEIVAEVEGHPPDGDCRYSPTWSLFPSLASLSCGRGGPPAGNQNRHDDACLLPRRPFRVAIRPNLEGQSRLRCRALDCPRGVWAVLITPLLLAVGFFSKVAIAEEEPFRGLVLLFLWLVALPLLIGRGGFAT